MGASAQTSSEPLERESEFEQLARSVAAAAAGEGSVVALEGEAGIGKSVLLADAVRRAEGAGMRVLSARGGELERDFGHGVVRQLFDVALMAMTPVDRARVFGGAAGLAATALSVTDVGGSGVTADAGSVLHGLYWLTANLAAERPLVIAVDDAHWADMASIAFLSYLARRIDGLALLVVYATRVGEGAAAQLPAAAEPGLVDTVLHPRTLSRRAAAELIGRQLGAESSEQFALACHGATAGNPFLLQELLRALHADGITPEQESCARVAQIAPGAISRAILARLRRLGRAATQLAFAIALLGKSAELRHAAALAKLDPDAAGDAADVLTSASILRDGRPLEFIHPIVRTTVYAEIPAAQRAAGHKRAALLLEGEGVAAADLAAHLMATEPAGDPAVVGRLRAAAAEVQARGAPAAGCTYLTRALAEPPRSGERARVLYELGRTEVSAVLPGAVGHLREALDGDLDQRTRTAAGLQLAVALGVTGRRDETMEALEASVARIAAVGDAETEMQFEGIFACAAQLDPATSMPVRARLQRYTGRLTGASLGERLLLAAMAFDAAHSSVPATRAAELAELALGDGRLLLERFTAGPNFALATWTLAYADRFERADELFTLAVDHARRNGSLVQFAIASACRCQVRFRQGRIAEAEAEARSTFEAASHAWVAGRSMLIACLIDTMVERADLDACMMFLAEQGIEEDLDTEMMGSRLLHSRGHLRLAAGDPSGALHDFEQIRAREERSGMATANVPTRASLALALVQLGGREQAMALAADELERARIWGTPSAVSFALRAAGIVAGGAAGIELLRQAAGAVEDSPARYERVRSLTEYGAALRRGGHRREAREPLREALELAHRCGARRSAARAHEELLAAGARPRRIALTGADALTPSERRVSRLAADGLSNRDIAQALFVTVRTVEGHLTQAYMKLDITRREQLAPALAPPAR